MVNGDFAKLTRKHGIKISAGFACTVEEIGLAVGEKVGHGSIKSLARMNSAVVIFLDQVEKVNCVIETGITRKGEFSSLRQWWDHGKTEIRLLCQQHTLNVTQDIIRSMKDLESDIVELETISETTGDRGYIEILKEKKMALANLLDVKVQGALVRSRFLNTNEMDAPTSFFFGLEKKNGQRRVIHSLLSGTGQEITEPSQIRRRAVSFYSTLYTSEYEEGETLSEGFCNGLPQVSEEANSQLEGPLTIQELQTALQGMQGRRAPGIDGLSVEFYKAYWDVLSHDLLDVFNESLASGSMPVSCRRAVITLLPKKGNLQDIKNWRPVSLLCVDYKILSKALATRLGKAVEQVIHRDQTYCVPGRSMVDNVHLIRDVLEVSSSLDINTGLISLDQEKAFDRVEHSFLWKVMEKFGFSAGFIAKIKVLYNKIESVLKFNARLDVSSSETPGLTVALCRSKTLCLQQLVDAVGPELSDAQALGSLLGLHSVRVAQRILQLWSQILCPEEKRLLRSYGQGGARPDPADPFPEIYLSPGLGELTGPLLQVSEEANSQLEGLLTIQELQTALQGMQGRRAPGIDGLSVEFYKAYWDVLSNDLLDVFNESLASGSMPVSCRRAVITLLPKKGNLQDIKNWRPVSLLCVDYKLLSKALATRLGRAVEQVIHRDQTYCVPGRSMVDNVHLIRDVLEVSSSLDINTGLISLDQEKAFDRVEHSFLWKVMEKFGFSAGFIAKIKVLYNKIESVLKFNGGLCAPFRVCRGVRQGCALSGMLYALSLEPLLSKIRSKLQGLFLPGFNGNLVLSAYADDVVVFVRDQTDIDVLVDIVREFSSASAARVNWKKSEALAVGEWSGGLPVLPQNMVWRKDGFKYLGVFLGKEIVVLKNWEDVTEKIEGKLSKLDVSNSETPGLTVALCRSKTLCLQQLVDAVGPELSDAQALGSLLGLHSVGVAQRILQLWSQILCPEEKRLLRSYGQGGARPDPADPFPEIYLSPGLGELTGPLLQLASTLEFLQRCFFSINWEKGTKVLKTNIPSEPQPQSLHLHSGTFRSRVAHSLNQD
ncbi:hypothetical protein NHX12_026024 [Muraenolepis orangiensis]|uniref:Reverse transcriptase domain-containing protein n=3 Tax=Muraenolepis orangiensis TaxID=630683 RepID=A0A9Q0EHV4_9TELE|nr:hypothetical protein NHX12_026024 [Muraenolepis orangiensis]